MAEPLSSLRMGFTRFDALPLPELPPEYGLRRYRPGDEVAWLEILQQGNFGEWDRARLDRLLAGNSAPTPTTGVFFATSDDRPIGTACTSLHHDEAHDTHSELGWVGVHPGHRGHGLGRAVCLAVLRYARDLGHLYTFLKTEDYRPAAIKTYLRLGFEPEMTDESHPGRWADLRLLLKT